MSTDEGAAGTVPEPVAGSSGAVTALEGLQIRDDLFKSVKYFITGTLAPNVSKLLEDGGATVSKFMDFSTHVVCGASGYDENEISQAAELYEVPSVTEAWVLASVRLGRLASTKAYFPLKSALFSNLTFAATQLDNRDLKRLFAAVTFHGGTFRNVFDSRTTHLISGSTKGPVYAKAVSLAGPSLALVTPDWAIESLRNNALLPTDIYHPRLVITPRIFKQATGQRPATPVQKPEPEKPLASIIGFDFEENIAKTEVPTSGGNGKKEDEPPANEPPKATIVQQTVPQQQPQIVPGGPRLQQIAGQQAGQPGAQMIQQQNIQQLQTGPGQQPKIIQQTIIHPPVSSNYQTITKQLIVGQQNPQGQQQQQQQGQQQQILQQQQQQQQQQQMQKPGGPPMVLTQGQNNQGQMQQQQQQQQPQIVQRIVQQQVLQGPPGSNQPGGQPQNIVIINQGGQQQQIITSSAPGQLQPGGQMQQMTQQQRIQYMQLQQQQQQQQKQQIIVSGSGGPGIPNQQQIMQQQQQQPGQQMGPNIVHIQQRPMQPGQLQQQQQQVMTSTAQGMQPQQTIVVQQQQQQQQQQQPTIIQQQMLGQQQNQAPQQQQLIIQQPISGGQPQQQIIQQTLSTSGGTVQQVMPGQPTIIQQQIVGPNAGQAPQGIEQQQTGPGGELIQPQQQQWTPQSPIQQQGGQQFQPQGGIPAGTTIIQQTIVPPVPGQPGQPQFIRSTLRPPIQRQYIQLDPQTHATLQKLDPASREEYINRLQAKQRMLMQRQQQQQQQQQFQVRPGVPAGVRPQQQIIYRGPMPQGLNQQQQMQWIQQQNAARQVRPGAPGLSPITQQQQQGAIPPGAAVMGQFPVDPNAQPQQQQRLQMERQQQQHRLLQMQLQREQAQKGVVVPGQTGPQGQAISPRGAGFPQEVVVGSDGTTTIVQQTLVGPPGDPNVPGSQQMKNQTKTALANMLSNRLGANGSVVPNIPDGPPGGPEPSAAGTLRMMTAQHNAALQQTMNPRLSQDMLALQQQQQQQQQQVVGPMQQQRRTLGNITNSGAPAGAMVVQQIPQGPPVFYGHNPNLKLHPELFLLGCTFYIIEYDESPFKNDVEDWKTIIRKHGGDIEQCYSPKVTHVLCRTQRHGVVMQAIRDAKRCITSYWLNDIVLKKQLLPPWQALHLPTPSIFGNQKPATKHNMSLTGFEGEERVRIKQMIEESGAKMTPYFSKSNTVLICKRIDNQKYKFAKDWNVPTVNTVWLSDILLGNLAAMQQCDGPKYQQFNLSCPFRIDYNLVMHLMTAWKSPINLTPESHERVKRSLSEPPQPATPPKKARTLPPLEAIPGEIVCQRQPDADSVPHVLFSQIDNTEGLMRAVMTLGGRIASGPADATHLVMTRVARTVKLITALTTVRYVLSSKWISDSASAGQFLPPENYRLDVKELDETFRCDLYKVLESPARNKLFEGKIFFITPQVKPSAKDVRQMIELSGGVVEKNPRSVKKIRETNLEKPGSYVIVGCPEDRIFIQPFIQKGKHGACQICTSEYVMQSILQQKLTIEPHVIKWELGS
ncbi:hypothetical protein pipiens_007212 [Culex pipiens pipiens]|uniref:PAX-interacting protein 1 n=2 Tax=Culex pipiens TaxID=7175 RepID=A0ABD1DLS4_CULPP